MGKFRQLSQELWPLIDVKSLFPLSILSIFLTDFLQTFSWRDIMLACSAFITCDIERIKLA